MYCYLVIPGHHITKFYFTKNISTEILKVEGGQDLNIEPKNKSKKNIFTIWES